MGKAKKNHRKRVQQRNAQKTSQQKAVMNHLKELGITPMQALQMMQEGRLKPSDEVVFGPKSTELKTPQHLISLTQSGQVATGDGLVDIQTGYATPYASAEEGETKNPQDKQ